MKLDYWQENSFKVNLILLILIFFLMSCSDQIEQDHDAATFNSLIEEYDFHSSKINIVIKDNIDIEKKQSGEIEIYNYDHTMGNLLSQGLRKHKDVKYGSYSMPHLLEDKIIIKFEIIFPKKLSQSVKKELEKIL